MPLGLSYVISGVTSALTLIALAYVLIAWSWNKQLRTQERALRAADPRDRVQVANAVFSHFNIDTNALTSDQQFNLAIAQIDAKKSERRWKIYFVALCAVLLAGVTAYTIGISSTAGPAPIVSTAEHKANPPVSPVILPDRRHAESEDVLLPFALRAIRPATLNDELTNGGDVSVTDLGSGNAGEVTRDGDLFMIRTRETEWKKISTAGYSGNTKSARTLTVSGYTISHSPCDSRAIYLPGNSLNVTDHLLDAAFRTLGITTSCTSIDKGLIVWQLLREAARSSTSPKIKKELPMIDYQWARKNYEACTVLGYEQTCQAGQEAFANMKKASFENLGLPLKYKREILKDIDTIPLRITYAKLRVMFGSRNYLNAARMAEDTLSSFDDQADLWEKIRISKRRF